MSYKTILDVDDRLGNFTQYAENFRFLGRTEDAESMQRFHEEQ